MANRNCNGIRGIIRSGNRTQRTKSSNHFHNLFLFGISIARYSLLYLQRRIFGNRDTGTFTCEQYHAAAMCNGNPGCNIGIKKKFLNGY